MCNVMASAPLPVHPAGAEPPVAGALQTRPCLCICNLPTFNVQRLPPCAYGCTTATSKCMPSSRGKCPPQ